MGSPILDVVLSQQLMGECEELTDLVEAWIQTYDSSKFEALRSILELILHSAGVLQPLTKEQALNINQMTVETFENLMSKPNVKPLILKDLYIKNLAKFLKLTLVGDVCLGDVLIMKRIQNLLQVFINSSWVSAHYTALMIGSVITEHYMGYWAQLDDELNDVLVVEKNKMSLTEKMEVVENFFEQFMKFVTICIRHVELYVRKIAVKIFFRWCSKKEQLVMTDVHLRNLYWTLYDDNASIRHMAVMGCRSLYASEYVIQNLPLFIQKTLPAVVKRTRDENSYVSSTALTTVSEVHRESPELLRDISLDPVFMMIYGEDNGRAVKAAEIFHDLLKAMSNTNMKFIFNTILFLEESKTELGDNSNIEGIVSIFVERVFPQSHRELADWSAWGQLLLGNSLDKIEHLHKLSCLFLINIMNFLSICADDRAFLETEFPPVPPLGDSKINSSENKENVHGMSYTMKNVCLNYLVQVTSNFGPGLMCLWEKYRNNKECLNKLVVIPQYFNGSINNLDMKGMWCYLTLLRNYFSDSQTLEVIHRSMACLYHLMLVSQKWKHFIPRFKHVLFKDVNENFLNACIQLTEERLQRSVEMYCLKIVKQAFFLSRFFNVTKTALFEDALCALRLGTKKNNAKVIRPTAMMCLYILQWQLKDVVEGDLNRNEMTARLYRIQSQSRTLVIQLESLMSTRKSSVRGTVFAVMCRLYAMLNPRNVYARDHPRIHLPPPSLEIQEWLNYSMSCQVSKIEVPEGKKTFEMSCEALRMFCFLLEIGVLNLSYVSSILIYLKFYGHAKNYNNILEPTIKILLNERRDLAQEVMESLIWAEQNTDLNVEEIAKGLCAVLSKLEPAVFAKKMMSFTLSKIRTPRNHFIFRILAPFVKLLEKKEAREVYESVIDKFHLYNETKDVNIFLSAFGKTVVLRGP